ncbi:MAG TPA: hypothetical protein P5256_01565 [Beijerinckiaceae bacterium]|nr:hypothetical protein [Rhodoblastus sp.]MCC2106166.1 hypothetical protein [Hyphomicrobiales bacterium]HPG02453.1 hypothetical protein [Rhodoblastus sp.]HRY01784.1 hypothetical protein [Beijerinckiaceae bacterium]
MQNQSFLTDPAVRASIRANHRLVRLAKGPITPLDAIVIEEILALDDAEMADLMPDAHPGNVRAIFTTALQRAQAA